MVIGHFLIIKPDKMVISYCRHKVHKILFCSKFCSGALHLKSYLFSVSILPKSGYFNVDNIRICKIVVNSHSSIIFIFKNQFSVIRFRCLLFMSVFVSFIFSFTVSRFFAIQGQGVQGSTAMQGMVFKRQVEGDITKVENCKVAVYSCPLDIMQTETKVSS